MIRVSKEKPNVINVRENIKSNKKIMGLFDGLNLPSKFNPLDLLSSIPKFSFKMTIENTNHAFANMIRVYLLTGRSVPSITITEYSTDDPYLILDPIRQNIELMPIKQDYDYKGIKITLNVANKTTEAINIYSKDLEFYRGDKKIDTSKIFAPYTVIALLNPGKKINAECKIEYGTGRENIGRFQGVTRILYKQLDELDKNTLVSNPSKYTLGFETYGDEDPKWILQETKRAITDDFDQITKLLKDVKSDNIITHINTKLKVSTIGSSETEKWYEFLFEETRGNITMCIAKYCYILDSSISVNAGDKHLLNKTAVLNISCKNPLKIINDAIKKIIEDVNQL